MRLFFFDDYNLYSWKPPLSGKIWIEIHNRVHRIRICGLPRIPTPNKLGFEPSLVDPLAWWNSTFLRPFDPPLSARYREQSLLCFASRLSRQTRAATSLVSGRSLEPGGVASHSLRWVPQSDALASNSAWLTRRCQAISSYRVAPPVTFRYSKVL